MRVDARDSNTTAAYLQEILERDGAVIVTNLISREMAEQIRHDLKPHFDADGGDQSGFFPNTTRRAIGLLGISPSCVDLALNPLFNEVASNMLTSKFTYWLGQEKAGLLFPFVTNPGGPMLVLLGAKPLSPGVRYATLGASGYFNSNLDHRYQDSLTWTIEGMTAHGDLEASNLKYRRFPSQSGQQAAGAAPR